MVAAGHTLKQTPTPGTSCYSPIKSLIQFRFAVIGSVRRRHGTAGAEGLRGNEALFMRTSLWYSPLFNRASPNQPAFCTGGHDGACCRLGRVAAKDYYSPVRTSRAQLWACQ